METIIANPKNKAESKAIITFLKSLKVDVEVYEKPSKEDVLKSIEQGAKEAKMYIDGKIKLQNAFDLINEL